MDEKIEFSSANVDMVEVNQNGDNLDGICRLCGNYDSQLMSTFSGAGISNYLYEKIIQHLTAIKISKSDNLPSQICYQCISTLITWDDLFEACVEVDKRLRRVLNVIESKKTARSDSSISTNGTDSALGGSAAPVHGEILNGYNFANNEALDFDIMNVDFSDIANLDDFTAEELALATPNFDYGGDENCFGNCDSGDLDYIKRTEMAGNNQIRTAEVGEMYVENETSPFLFQSFCSTKQLNNVVTNATSTLPLENITFDASDLLPPNDLE